MKFKLMALIIALLELPLYFYFLYKILQHIQATELMWFLYWMLLPIAIISGILTKLAEWEED